MSRPAPPPEDPTYDPRAFPPFAVTVDLAVLTVAAGALQVLLVERDDHGKVFEQPVSAPDIRRAWYTTDKHDDIALEFDQPMRWHSS